MTEKSGEDALVEARRNKAEHLRSRGQNPFANDAQVADRSLLRELRLLFASALLEPASELRYDPAKVEAIAEGREFHVLGRVVARRGFGKASFLRLRDLSDELQIFAKQDVLGEGFAALEDIDIADHIEVRGLAMVTKTGELSVQATSLRLLTKAMRPLPDKWHGLSDVDIRYRRRYVDLVANPDVAVALRARSIIVQGLRDFLDAQGFLEVETPTLHSLIGGATARPFKTHHNALDLELFLRIAPELYLKRLLVGGLERVYEIGRCYRNEGISTRHNPEFTMLEFYWAYATYDVLMDFTETMIRFVDAALATALPEAHAKWLAARPFAIDEPFAQVSMDRAVVAAAERTAIPEWLSAVGEGGGDALVTVLKGSFGERIKEWAKSSPRAKGLDWTNFRKAFGKCDSDGERLFACYEYLAEPFLVDDYRTPDGKHSVPVFVMDYPFEVSPLARR